MKNQLDCNHYQKKAKKTSVYSYDLIGSELNLCIECEAKLRKQIIEQDQIEKELEEEMNKK